MPVLEKPDVSATASDRPVRTARTRVEGFCMVLLSLVATVYVLRFAQAVILPFILALLIFYALDPVVTRISGLGIPRVVGSFLLIIVLLATGAWSIYLLRDQASDVFDRLPEAIRKARTAIQSREGAPHAVAKVQQAAGELEKTATEATGVKPSQGVTRVQIEEPLFKASDFLWSGSIGLLSFIGQTVMILFLVFFLLASGDLYKRKFVEVVGPRFSRQRLTVQILSEIDQQIGRFLLIQVMASVIVGVATGLSLWLLGLNQAAMWGVTTGVLVSIPYFGAIVVTAALSLVAFLQFGNLEMAAIVAAVIAVVTGIDGFLLKPLLTGRFGKINNLVTFMSLLFWGWLWGPLGMLLAIPITMVIKSICDRIDGLQPIGHLLGESK